MKRIRNYIPILIPLIISAIRRSVELAEALESRAFGASENRTAVTTLKMDVADYAAMAATAFGVIIAIYVYLYVPLPTLIGPIKMPRLF